jgi:septation ring formation regulator EzrA
MHPAFALVSEKLSLLAIEAQKLSAAESTVHAALAKEGGETPLFVATNSRASAIESLYTGIEGILKETLAAVQEPVYSRKGEDQHRWHAQLLAQAAQQTDERPAIVSEALKTMLDELRRFRYVERNSYGHQLDANRVAELVTLALAAADSVKEEIPSFVTQMTEKWAKDADGLPL